MRWLELHGPLHTRLLCALLCALLALALAGQPATAATRDPANTAAAAAGAFIALCYHEVRNDVRDYPDPYAVDDGALVAQFAWLRGNGYTPVSIDEIIAARAGGKPLPAQAVLLTFDDAYLSFYTRVYPLLREFRFPAVLAVVGSWIDTPQGENVQYGEKGSVPRASFPTWGELREMAASGLVEIASHTYDLHRGVPANPQGNLQPAATARVYDAATRTYENDASWRARMRADLARNAEVIARETGRRPRAIVWPYGSYNDELVRMAGELGSAVALTLGDGANTIDVPLTAVRRRLVEHNPALADFVAAVRGPQYPAPVRAVQIDLDDVYSADPLEQERNLSALLDRIQIFKPTHVYLKAYAGAAGVAEAVYFPNRHVAMRADLFNRAAWQLATRTDAIVVALLPVAGFHLRPNIIAEVYEDLARYANFEGLLFNDDPALVASAGASSVEFTQQLAVRARAFRAPLMIARSLDAGPLAARIAHEPAYPGDARKVVFMLHNPGSRSERNPRSNVLAQQMRALQLRGELNFGYRPDDFRHDDPPLAKFAPAMSLRVYPPQSRPAGLMGAAP